MKIVEKFQLGMLYNNAYLLEINSKIILIDAPYRTKKIIEFLEEEGLTLDEVWLTHTHFDHIVGLGLLSEKYPNLKIYAPEEEIEFIKIPEANGSMNMKNPISYSGVVLPFTEEKAVEENMRIGYISGHSLQSANFIFENEKVMIVGDSLFRGTIGRSDFKFGNEKLLKKGIKEELFAYEEDYEVLPGHGEETTLMYEKENNEMVR